ncbi:MULTISPECIES: Fic family protein, partial [Clostridium]|uniref:Fic family protein n=1 Tax=Clostridium TaxID=1485 RepID=UPI000174EA69
MQELIRWYKENTEKFHPIELAAEFHLKYVYISPFIDGNGKMFIRVDIKIKVILV